MMRLFLCQAHQPKKSEMIEEILCDARLRKRSILLAYVSISESAALVQNYITERFPTLLKNRK